MNWLKKWCYLILLVGTGAVYLVFVDDWQVYARPMAAVRDWCDVLLASENKNTGTGSESGENRQYGGSPDGVGNQPSVSESDAVLPQLPKTGEDGISTPRPDTAADESGIQQTVDETPEGDGTFLEDGSEQPGDDPGDAAGTDNGEDCGQEEPVETGVSYMAVEDDYFADAVFIGDSRTVGMYDFGGLREITTFYASTGLSVHKMFTAAIVPVQGQKKKITVDQALQENTFAKIYLMIGINEMGTGTVDTFMEKYEEAVTRLKELQPDAIIYLQGIMKVTAERSAQGDYITNEGIEERNERIAQLADNRTVFYLDVNEVICDETGGMTESYTHDGVHLKGKYVEIWREFLKEHAVEQ